MIRGERTRRHRPTRSPRGQRAQEGQRTSTNRCRHRDSPCPRACARVSTREGGSSRAGKPPPWEWSPHPTHQSSRAGRRRSRLHFRHHPSIEWTASPRPRHPLSTATRQHQTRGLGSTAQRLSATRRRRGPRQHIPSLGRGDSGRCTRIGGQQQPEEVATYNNHRDIADRTQEGRRRPATTRRHPRGGRERGAAPPRHPTMDMPLHIATAGSSARTTSRSR